MMTPEKAERMAGLLKAIAHPVRLRVLSMLLDGEANVTQLLEQLGLPQSAVSSQLAILRMNGLVEVRRAGGFAWYSLNKARLGEVLACVNVHSTGGVASSATEAE